MKKVDVPALVRTRVAGQVAKRMPVAVTIEVQPERPGDPIVGLIEVEKSLFPFGKGERSEQVLAETQKLDIGAIYASYSVSVTSEKPVTLLVGTRGAISVWLLVIASAVICFAGALVFLFVR